MYAAIYYILRVARDPLGNFKEKESSKHLYTLAFKSLTNMLLQL